MSRWWDWASRVYHSVVDEAPTDNYGVITADSVIRAPHDDALRIAGDLQITARVALDDWTSVSTPGVIAARRDSASTFSQEYLAQIPSSGGAALMRLDWTDDGDTDHNVTSATSIDGALAASVADGAWLWLRWTLDVDDGAGNRVVTFEASADATNDVDEVSWTTVDTDTAVGTTTVIDRTNHLEIAGYSNGSSPLLGKLQYVAVSDGGGEHARLDLRSWRGAGAVTDPYDNEFTLTDVAVGSGT